MYADILILFLKTSLQIPKRQRVRWMGLIWRRSENLPKLLKSGACPWGWRRLRWDRPSVPQRAPRTASQPSAGNPRLHAPPLPAGLGLLCPCSSAFLLRVGKAGGVQGGNKGWGGSVLKWVVAMGMKVLTQTCGPWLGNSCQLTEPPRRPPGKDPTPASSRLQVGVGAKWKAAGPGGGSCPHHFCEGMAARISQENSP